MDILEIHTLAELDHQISDIDASTGIERHNKMAFDFKLPSAPFSGLDPFSLRYSQEVQKLYAEVAGRDYNVASESNVLAFEKQEPYPYMSRHPATIGAHLSAIALVLRDFPINTPGRILDIGAGWGNTSLLFARAGFHVDAVDINLSFLEVINYWAERLQIQDKIVTCSLKFDEISSLPGPYEAVLFFESFHHSLNHAELIGQLSRLLVEDGVIVFAGEPIYPAWYIPWGLRPEGLAIYCIRKLGWLELGFDEVYFLSMLRKAGFYAEKRTYVDNTIASGYVARRLVNMIPLACLAIPEPYVAGWNLPDGSTIRWTRGRAGLPFHLIKRSGSAVIRLSNYGPVTQTIRLFADQTLLVACDLVSADTQAVAFDIPSLADVLWIDVAPWSPSDLGMSSDTRTLGVAVHDIAI